uniref:CJ090 protein n=1 Tax=Hydatigena taeniaeformis TaxID=6205 RepID=A0A0R3WY67_HYDTA
LGPAVALKSRTNSSGQLLSHAVSSDPLLTSIPAPGTVANPIPLQGHMLQRIHFRVPAVCKSSRDFRIFNTHCGVFTDLWASQ